MNLGIVCYASIGGSGVVASELAHAVPPGHAVLSLTSVRGEHAPPLLVDLRS